MKSHRFSRICILFLTLILICLVSMGFNSYWEGKTHQSGYIDIHMHFSNQLERMQRGRRPNRRPPSPSNEAKGQYGAQIPGFSDKDFIECADHMIQLMDQYGVEKALVMPQPRIEGQPGFYEYKQILPALEKYPDRLFLGGGGGTLNSMIHGVDANEVTQSHKDRFKQEATAVIQDGARLFGEFAALHVSLTPQHVFEEVAPDHPLFLLLADIAAEHNISIDIHMEAVVEDTPCPDNLRRISTKNPSVFKANIPAFDRLLAHNRKANIIWQHIGWDNIGQMTIPLLQDMLNKHPNLFLGFKIEERPFQVGTRTPMPNRIVDDDYNIKPEWMAFFKENPDRLLVATDQFVGIPGKTKRPPQYLKETWTPMKQLPENVLIKVCRDNAARLFNLN